MSERSALGASPLHAQRPAGKSSLRLLDFANAHPEAFALPATQAGLADLLDVSAGAREGRIRDALRSYDPKFLGYLMRHRAAPRRMREAFILFKKHEETVTSPRWSESLTERDPEHRRLALLDTLMMEAAGSRPISRLRIPVANLIALEIHVAWWQDSFQKAVTDERETYRQLEAKKLRTGAAPHYLEARDQSHDSAIRELDWSLRNLGMDLYFHATRLKLGWDELRRQIEETSASLVSLDSYDSKDPEYRKELEEKLGDLLRQRLGLVRTLSSLDGQLKVIRGELPKLTELGVRDLKLPESAEKASATLQDVRADMESEAEARLQSEE